MHHQLLGSTQPVLSLCLEPGESVIGPAAEFAWMTDSIQLAAGPPGLSRYTATGAAGTIVFAARQPGHILSVDVAPGSSYLVDGGALLATTPGIEVTVVCAAQRSSSDLGLRTISGQGRAWVGLSGDAVRHELAAGASLRAQPWHVGLTDASITVQLADLPDPASHEPATGTRPIAVLSGPGQVWLQSMTPRSAAPGVPGWLSGQRRGPAGGGDRRPAPPLPPPLPLPSGRRVPRCNRRAACAVLRAWQISWRPRARASASASGTRSPRNR